MLYQQYFPLVSRQNLERIFLHIFLLTSIPNILEYAILRSYILIQLHFFRKRCDLLSEEGHLFWHCSFV
ncbi:protein of unknown function (plasmid) [Azospirillum baldaniorum]|uniref:Uncharacterized protein n=1 Tax=Azospirillum baldaniorum TaxID=1064539 RepID=A0A9P1K1Z4_9PROT|nr:protein of unknown function [Azospirillum baldaniorum]